MEKLINSIKLISFNYMYSSNKTLDRFGIEYSYIASAMNSMLKSTNNGIKNVNISESNGIIIDANWWCVVAIIGYIGAWAIEIIGALSIPATLGLSAGAWLFGLFLLSSVALAGVAHTCGW